MKEIKNFRQKLIAAASEAVGTWYKWGGQSLIEGFDCSGFIIHCLRRAGVDIIDMTAAELAEHFHHNKMIVGLVEPGDLLFYGESAVKITHVMMVYRIWKRNGSELPLMTIVGARGGDEKTKTIEDAYRNNALVDVVKGNYWQSNFQFARGVE